LNDVSRVLRSESNRGPSRPKYLGSGQRVHSNGRIWEVLWNCDIVGGVSTQHRTSFWTTDFIFDQTYDDWEKRLGDNLDHSRG